jgi:hypothetical protein
MSIFSLETWVHKNKECSFREIIKTPLLLVLCSRFGMDSREPLRYNKTHFFHLTTWPLMSSAFFSLFKQVKIAQFLAQELCSKEFQTVQLNVVNKKV